MRVELSADASAQAGTYQIQLLAGRQRVAVPTSITVTLPPAALLPMPTLKVVPSVTSASPASVTLVVGGSEQTLALIGTVLNSVTGAYVERNGSRLAGVTVNLVPSTDPARRELRLSALATAGPPWGVPLDLVLEAGTQGAPVKIPTPVHVEVWGTLRVDDAVFSSTVKGVLDNMSASFNSCGATDTDRRFSVILPAAPYSASGAVARLERGTTTAERVMFLEDHTIDGSDIITGEILNLLNTNTIHPSPIPHTVTAVRMCLEPMNVVALTVGAAPGNSAAAVVATLTFSPATFRARGMPADPTGTVSGINVNILWGSAQTDRELPDWIHLGLQYEIRLPLEVVNGGIRYGSPDLTRKGAAPSWTSMYLGPSNLRSLMESWAGQRMTQVEQELEKAFESLTFRNTTAGAPIRWEQW